MTFPMASSLAAFVVAALSAGISCVLLSKKESTSFHRALAGFLGVTALTNVANGLGLLDDSHALLWRKIGMVGELAQPAALLYIGLALLKPSDVQGMQPILWPARAAAAIASVFIVLTITGHVYSAHESLDGRTAIGLGSWSGHFAYIYILLGMTLSLAQLEAVLSASREPLRYQLKFILIGLGALASYQIYQASQMLLFSFWQAEYVFIGALVTVMALGLVSFGLMRSKLREMVVNAYVSHQALYGSIAFMAIGLYLLAVGAAGEWLRRTGQPLWKGLGIVLAFGSLIALVVLLFSKKAGSEIRRFIARNFYRSKYDYRARWLEVAQTFQHATTKEAILDGLFDLLTTIFPTTSISIWSFREADRRFWQVRPATAGSNGSFLIELSHPILTHLINNPDPLLLHQAGQVNDEAIDASLAGSRVALCVPIRAQGKLTAFVVFGKLADADTYDTDDCDLLSGIAHHVGVLLSHAALSEERQASAEFEALHRFSAFCLHDLKNLAARLSLIAQNVGSHGRDPAFQDSAMRTVSDTAKQITALISKLSLKSPQPVSAKPQELVDLHALVEEVVAPIAEVGSVPVRVHGGPVGLVLGMREQLHQVLLNTVLNAQQAIGKNGFISITVKQLGSSIRIDVEDTGVGIPADRMETLFRPSPSRQVTGLGIGLYQSKQIIEAHRGTIQVRSEEGKGTRVHIEVPVHCHPEANPEKVMASSTAS